MSAPKTKLFIQQRFGNSDSLLTNEIHDRFKHINFVLPSLSLHTFFNLFISNELLKSIYYYFKQFSVAKHVLKVS